MKLVKVSAIVTIRKGTTYLPIILAIRIMNIGKDYPLVSKLVHFTFNRSRIDSVDICKNSRRQSAPFIRNNSFSGS